MLNQRVALDQVFQALADPTRRSMLERLSRGPASVSELAEPHAMSLPAVVQHLQLLETTGLVRSQKVGRVRTCRMELLGLSQAHHWIEQRRASCELGDRGGALAERGPSPRRSARGRKGHGR